MFLSERKSKYRKIDLAPDFKLVIFKDKNFDIFLAEGVVSIFVWSCKQAIDYDELVGSAAL